VPINRRIEMSESWLFSYGTLRQPNVQLAVFGRRLESNPDSLPGFRVEVLTITDPEVIAVSGSAAHPILRRGAAGESVAGSALAVTAEDLSRADGYEAADYVRVGVDLASGRRAFVYLHCDDVTAAEGRNEL
jgi:hypothetical protein